MRKDVAEGASADFVLAIKHLMNRDQMRQIIALGHAALGSDQPIAPGSRFHFAGLPQRPFDLGNPIGSTSFCSQHVRNSSTRSGNRCTPTCRP